MLHIFHKYIKKVKNYLMFWSILQFLKGTIKLQAGKININERTCFSSLLVPTEFVVGHYQGNLNSSLDFLGKDPVCIYLPTVQRDTH